MDNEIKKNFEEKLNLISSELLATLDIDFETMLRRHSSDGLLHSGKTIKATMDLISRLVTDLYTEALDHVKNLKIDYSPSIETEIVQLVDNSKDRIESKFLSKFQKSTEIAGKPDLYERLLPELNTTLATNQAVFKNQLNLIVIALKKSKAKSSIEKVLWFIELIIVSASIFICGMWFSEPSGNYEPVLVGLGLVIPLIYLVIRRISTPKS